MYMNKTNRIRTFFVLGAGLLIAGGSYWNYTVQRQEEAKLAKEKQQIEATKEDDTRETVSEKKSYEYVIVNEDGYLTVYEKDLKTVFLHTDISYEELPEELRQKVGNGYPIRTPEELYDFLENYSS